MTARLIAPPHSPRAWRRFGYDRRMILTLQAMTQPVLYSKEGLLYERRRIEELWEKDLRFALHNDLTN